MAQLAWVHQNKACCLKGASAAEKAALQLGQQRPQK
jgi:hypothetical protein